jgi:DNA polymerase-3 subunit gamma/tau
MSHIALYRSWRPQTFAEIVGQEHITQTLQNSLREGRFTHAYLFSGPRGTGKTSAAKILAKAVNCERGLIGEPCNECSSCIRITEGAVMDVIELDAASNNGVDEIRDIRDKVKYAPTEVRQKVYIIDEVHMLSIGAANALLKTLEEPPPHVMFILATTEPHKLPVTIVSRCQRFDFRRVALEDQVARLDFICKQEAMSVDADALQYIARLSDGGMRDALSLLDQIAAFAGDHISYADVLDITGGIASDQFYALADAVRGKDIGAVLAQIDRLMQEGKSAERCIESLIHYFRDLLMLRMVPDAHKLTDRIVDASVYRRLADSFDNEELFRMIDILSHYQVEMKYASQPQTLFEVALMKVCSSGSAAPQERDRSTEQPELVQQLARKVDRLEQQLSEMIKSRASGPIASAGPGLKPGAPQPTRATGAASSFIKKGTARLGSFVSAVESPGFKQVLTKWGQVLSRVKDQKITVHAWLVDGEPVSATNDAVLVAFKNTIHRETTEKPANKQMIEQVVGELLGKPLRLETTMHKDWSDALAASSDASGSSGSGGEPREVLQLEPDSDHTGKHKEEWINEAIQLFGEELVTIKED